MVNIKMDLLKSGKKTVKYKDILKSGEAMLNIKMDIKIWEGGRLWCKNGYIKIWGWKDYAKYKNGYIKIGRGGY